MLSSLLTKQESPFKPQVVGQPLPRVDGTLKVTRTARFTAEHYPDGMVHGSVIGSDIARGRIVSVDTSAAEALQGVIAAITPASAPKLKPLPDKVQVIQHSGEGGLIEMQMPMQDDCVHYSRVISPRSTCSQLRGGALTEKGLFDPNNDCAVVRNLADSHIPSHADVPDITVETFDIPDPQVGQLGAGGLGEIGTTNVPAAVRNAVFNATGRRLRSLPLTPDRMMESLR